MNPIKQLLRIISLAKNDITVLLIYGVTIGLFSLIIPVAAQSLVTLVSFGSVIQPIFMLALLVFVLLGAAATFRIFQNILAENIQQRIFTKVGLRMARRLPKVTLDTYDQNQGPELLNRFFDVITIQKTTATILVTGLGVFLQAVFGMILLAIYHPILLMFDVLFILSLTLALYLPCKKALVTAIDESTQKYRVVSWLEEIARLPLLFKFQSSADYALVESDLRILEYLKCRQKHFKKLLVHFVSTYIIQVLASSALLLIGGLLVINNQLTLGQLVAAEIVINALGASVSRLGVYLENIYDLLASADKVGNLLDLPLESTPNLIRETSHPILDQVSLSVSNLLIPNSGLSPITFQVQAGEKVCLLGGKWEGHCVVNQLLGLEKSQATITYNDMSISELPIESVRDRIGLLRDLEFFDGSLRDNIELNTDENDGHHLQSLIKLFDLADPIAKLDQGINTNYLLCRSKLTQFELMKIVLVRLLLKNPGLMIIDGAFDNLSNQQAQSVIKALIQIQSTWSLFITTQRTEISNYFDRTIAL